MSDTLIKEDTQPLRPIQYDEEPPPPRRSGGCGCWLPALATLFLVAVLVVVGLFLPPIDLYNRLFGVQYTTLSAESNAVRSPDGSLTLIADPNDPGQNFGVALASVARGAATTDAAASAALAAIPPTLAQQSPLYAIQTQGTSPRTLALTLNLPAGLSADVADVYGWYADENAWRFVPAHSGAPGTLTASVSDLPDHLAVFQAAPQQATVLVAVDAVQVLSPEVASIATIVAPGGLQPTLDGKLTGSLAAGFELNRGYLVMPVIRNYADPRALDPDTVAAIINNRAQRSEHVAQLVAFAAGGGFAGVIVDYRDLPADQREAFSLFIRELGQAFDRAGLQLGVVVPAAVNADGQWQTGAYDWRALGAAVDYLQINLGLDPATFAPGADRLVEAMLRWAVGEASRSKILLGLSALSVRQVNGAFTPVSFQDALAALGDVEIEAEAISETGTINPGTLITARLNGFSAVSGMDTVIQSPFVDFTDSSGAQAARLWLTTAEALRFRMDRTGLFGLGGVAFEDLLAAGVADGALTAITNYKLGLPGTSMQTELALRWRIESADGLLGEVVTGLNEPLVATIQAPEGNYAVNVSVIGQNLERPRSGAAVALFAPTPTPTPLPTNTPTPLPTNTPVPPTIAPTQPPAPAAPAGPPPSAPGAGSIVAGGFEYGGHVSDPSSPAAVGAMRRAGMTWMKVQIRYSNGATPDIASGTIGAARAQGFKILLGVVGSPAELAAGGESYLDTFADFLGGVAALGPDAIEVWNEPNIDREWPRGAISGAAYADMLRRAYQKIKGANGSVLVISGAPAPTGAEAAFPGQVVNDDNFIRDMVAAGALQYLDCVGAHYNEGIVGPSATSGDPRDNYYTRYFFGMLNTYWALTGGQKPICFTELGYLTPEGLGPLPDFFGWASNVTLAQQAAWLAEAAALSSQSGKVRLMIVWNVDFSAYGSDPMAGYAMIRPGGGCPACDALAAAR